MPTYPVSVTVDNPDGCPCPTCPPPPPLPCPACESGFPGAVTVIVGGAANSYTARTWGSSYYGVITVEGDLTFELNGSDPGEFDALYPNQSFVGAMTAGGYEIKGADVGGSGYWALYRTGMMAPVLNLVPQAFLPGGAAANDGQSTHLRLVWDSAAGTVTGYAAAPGQPEEMVGQLTGQWTPYSSFACLGGFDLGGQAYVGTGAVITAENLTESCGGGVMMTASAARVAPPLARPDACEHLGKRSEFRAGCGGLMCRYACDLGLPAVPGGSCQDCPGYVPDEHRRGWLS